VADRRSVAAAPADTDARAWLAERAARLPTGTPARLLLSGPHLAVRYVRLPFTDTEKLRAVLPYELVLPWDAGEVRVGTSLVEKGDKESLLLAVAAPNAPLRQAAEAVSAAGFPSADALPLGAALPLFLVSRGVVRDDTLFLCCAERGGRRMAWLAALHCGRLTALRRLASVEDEGQLGRWAGATLQAVSCHLGQRLTVEELVTLGCDGVQLAGRWRCAQRSLHELLTATPLAGLAAADPLQLEAAAAALLSHRRPPLALELGVGPAAPGLSLPFGISRRRLGAAAALFGTAALLWLADLGVAHHDLARRLAFLDTQIRREFQAAMPQARRLVDPVAQLQAALLERRRGGQGPAFAADPSPLAVLADLSRSAPEADKLVVEEVEIAPENVSLRGRGPSFNTLDRLRESLAALAWADRVEIVGAELDQRGGVVRFDLEIKRRRP
ncbi:MAG TPA: hypothetical protein ENJ73_02445, partial [Desulfobacterales bacterium]|nr:hypothetical protein [Desulfobacterales bacterium]